MRTLQVLLFALLCALPSFALDKTCDGALNRQPFTLSTASGNTQVLAAIAGRQIVICHISFNGDATGTLKITQGTGTNCGSNTADVTGSYYGLSGLSRDPTYGALYLTVGYAACINFGTSTNAGGVILYAVR